MKKINSIWFGGKLIVIGIVFLAVIPLIFFAIEKLWLNNIFLTLEKISIAIGLSILFIFMILLFIEFNQDKRRNSNYKKMR